MKTRGVALLHLTIQLSSALVHEHLHAAVRVRHGVIGGVRVTRILGIAL